MPSLPTPDSSPPLPKSAFSLGWETAEEGGILHDNPFELDTIRYEQFIAGFNAFLDVVITKENPKKQRKTPKRKRT